MLPQTIQLTVRQTDTGPILDCDGVFIKEYVQIRDFKHIINLLNLKDKIKKYIEENPPKTYKDNQAVYNKAIFSITHVPQRKFVKLVQGKMFEAFVKPIPENLRLKLCFGPGGHLSPRRIKAVTKSLPILMQAVEDKQDNILPYLLHFGKSPSELKATLGKGLWKRMCATTFSRNKAIVSYISAHPTPYSVSITDFQKQKLLEAFELPTTLLNLFSTRMHNFEVALYAKLQCKGGWSSPLTMQNIFITYQDTAEMRKRYDNKDSKAMLTWSTKRLNAEHEAYIKRSFIEKYSDKPFTWAEELGIGTFSYKGYEVTPLLSEMEIGVEGQAMQHCVGMYGSRSSRQEYLVCSVKKNGERYSTIGIRMYYSNLDLMIGFDQQYMKYNKRVEDPIVDEIPQFIIDSLVKWHNQLGIK